MKKNNKIAIIFYVIALISFIFSLISYLGIDASLGTSFLSVGGICLLIGSIFKIK